MTDAMIARAEAERLVSQPSFAEFPANAPIHAAFRMIKLREGTRPPLGGMNTRVAFGTARTAQDAARLAGFEAIERFALQYSQRHADPRESLLASDGQTHVLPVDALCLGAPATNGKITSKGAAAGPSHEAATMRAILECLEHALGDIASTHMLSAEMLPQDLLRWLHLHLRDLQIQLNVVPEVGLLIRAVCADMDGGRPTYGTALSNQLHTGVWHAASEAVVSWRNMVMLDFNGVTQDGMAPEQKRLFQLYRGAERDRARAPSAPFDADTWHAPDPTLTTVLTAVSTALDQPVAVFDMTAPELPLPVVKAVPV
ncbi:MAG: YcaO-like family protein [Pseudomonadota bacterium]